MSLLPNVTSFDFNSVLKFPSFGRWLSTQSGRERTPCSRRSLGEAESCVCHTEGVARRGYTISMHSTCCTRIADEAFCAHLWFGKHSGSSKKCHVAHSWTEYISKYIITKFSTRDIKFTNPGSTIGKVMYCEVFARWFNTPLYFIAVLELSVSWNYGWDHRNSEQ